MTTYRTGNPIGSADPRDLYDNAENLDELVNSQDKAEHPDRLGVPRKTWHGMEGEFDTAQVARAGSFSAAQSERELQFNQFIASSGYTGTGVDGAVEDYAAGIIIAQYNQIIRGDGEFWRIGAETELPYTTTGAGLSEGGVFVPLGDAVLRQELVMGSVLPAANQYNYPRPGDAARQADIATRKPHQPSIPSIPMGDMNLDGQAVHPCVVRTPEGFGPQRFKYWMAVTPYQNSDAKTENPCIYGSYDGASWQVPNGVTNPLVPAPDEHPSDHLSDPCLLLHSNELWYYYRESLSGASGFRDIRINLMRSSDGSTWSAPVTCSIPPSSENLNMSPAVFHDGTKFVMYIVDRANNLERTESDDGVSWGPRLPVTLSGPGLSGVWHVHAVVRNERIEMLVNTRQNSGTLVFCTSAISDGLAFERKSTVVDPFYDFESRGIYHGSLVPSPDNPRSYEIWYSAHMPGVIWSVARIAATLDGDILTPVIDNDVVAVYGSLSAAAGHFYSISTAVPIDIPSVISGRSLARGNTEHGAAMIASSGSASGTRSAVLAGVANNVSGNYSAIIAGSRNSVTGGFSAVLGGQDSDASGDYSATVGGQKNSVSGRSSSVLGGQNNTASGTYASVLGGQFNTASTNYASVLGGLSNTASGTYASVLGGQENTSEGSLSAIIGGNSNLTLGPASATVGGYLNETAASAATIIASTRVVNNTSSSLALGFASSGETLTTNQKIRLESVSGTIRAANTTIQGMDYAELFENGTGAEIPPGTILTLDGAGKVVPAADGDKIVGVVSHTYGILGGESFACWDGRYLKDEWGRQVWEYVADPEDADQTIRVRKENPEYDASREYVSRENRPDEWTPVGLLGQVLVRVTENVSPGDSVAADGGVGVKSGELTGVRCMSIISPFDSAKGYAIAMCLINVRV